MHLTVGYLATPTGDDGVALAASLANTFDATVDVVVVVREEFAHGHPARAEYQHLLVHNGEEWISQSMAVLAESGVSAKANVLVGESYSASLIAFAEEHNSGLIVIGGARDGTFSGHVIGSVAGALLHCSPIPVALAPRGYSEDPPERITSVTAAVPTRPGADNPLSFATTLASASGLSIRMLSLVSAENLAQTESLRELRQMQVAAAEQNLLVAARMLPCASDIESLVVEGTTLESALEKLSWADSDLLVVGSSRFAAPKRVFLGSTAARILAGSDAPVILFPRDEYPCAEVTTNLSLIGRLRARNSS